MKFRIIISLSVLLTLVSSGCFHAAVVKHAPAPDKSSIRAPYDMTWDATLAVVKKNGLTVQAQDPVHGIVEAQGRHFTLKDADCGVVSTPLGKTPAEPTDEATTVYNIYLAPDGPEATKVSIQGNFSTPGNAPFHPTRDLGCVSTGHQEARMLKQIREQVAQEHRPVFKLPAAENPSTLTPTGPLQLPAAENPPALKAPAQLQMPAEENPPTLKTPTLPQPPATENPPVLKAPAQLEAPAENPPVLKLPAH